MICEGTIVRGAVEIGAGAIIHPLCEIIAENLPTESQDSQAEAKTHIGERSIIEERCRVLNSSVGDGSLVRVGSVILNSQVCFQLDSHDGSNYFLGRKLDNYRSEMHIDGRNHCWEQVHRVRWSEA